MIKEPDLAFRLKSLKNPRRAGMALVIVLGCVVLLAVLLVAFLASVGTELKSSKIYAEGATVRLLAQSAVNLVSAEIREATQTTGGTWASQPGMIRTWNTNGSPDRYFKLYSDADMVGSGTFNAAAAASALSGWSSSPAIYTDLNQPATFDGVSHYPIVDGNNLTSGGGYADIEGFQVKSTAPVATSGAVINPVPMPVRWLYVLADGRVVAPTGSGTATIDGASLDNPIVGRMAFWTDDESAKVNINTASEGSYWDTPKVSGNQDVDLFSKKLPLKGEYQRYPGHPATTSLSAVFGQLASTPEAIYPMTPRYMPGGSEGGTVETANLPPDSFLKPSPTSPGTGNNRLYASIDEFLFQPDRTENSSQIDKTALEQAKFFITTSSRSPDLNLFGKPRVGIWPIFKDQALSRTTAFDRLIAFCSTFNDHIFYFQREDPFSPTNDLPGSGSATGLGRNRMLLEYLRDLTSKDVPGFGGSSFRQKYGVKDRDQILTQIFDYIRSVNLNDPTVGTPFNTIINKGQGSAPGGPPIYEMGIGQVVPIEDTATDTRGFGRFPTVMGGFLLFVGRPAPAVPPATEPPPDQAEVQAVFYVNMFNPAHGYIRTKPTLALRVTGLNGFQWTGVNTAGTPTPLQPMGFRSPGLVVPTVYYEAEEPGTGGVITFTQFSRGQSRGPAEPSFSPGVLSHYQLISANINMRKQSGGPLDPPTEFFEFQGGPVTVEILAPDPANPDNLAAATVVQTVTLNFPDSMFPVPREVPHPWNPTSPDDIVNFQYLEKPPTGGNSRFWYSFRSPRKSFITPYDVVRAVVLSPTGADARLVLPRKTISAAETGTFFEPHSLYTAQTQMLAHNLRNGLNRTFYGAKGGRLLQLNYHQWNAGPYIQNDLMNIAPRDCPTVPDTVTSNILGDWDNGIGYLPDGPYINKADEGDRSLGSSGAGTPYYPISGTDHDFPITDTLFSPSRMMPSAGMFGSLPTGVWALKPWQTLLFNPNPLAGSSHPGFNSPPDHLLLDLFHMPVVEPYAISDPLSTAGRVNMNYQIVPFTWIHRDTGMRAVLKSEKIIAIPDSAANTYKRNSLTTSSPDVRHDINLDATLQGFESRFAANDIFRSATEICTLPLVPAISGFSWNNYRLTGDNSRERPYTTIYPRLTTKSNTFTVHVRVQTLKKVKDGSPANEWREGRDQVTGEYRGSQIIERYIDPNDPNLPDFADPSVSQTIDPFYKFRTVTSRQFAP